MYRKKQLPVKLFNISITYWKTVNLQDIYLATELQFIQCINVNSMILFRREPPKEEGSGQVRPIAKSLSTCRQHLGYRGSDHPCYTATHPTTDQTHGDLTSRSNYQEFSQRAKAVSCLYKK